MATLDFHGHKLPIGHTKKPSEDDQPPRRACHLAPSMRYADNSYPCRRGRLKCRFASSALAAAVCWGDWFGDDLLSVQLKPTLRANEDVGSQVVLLLKKCSQCIAGVFLLALRNLPKAPTKTVVAVGESNQKRVPNLLAENLLN